jgi:hypothetical protein
LTFDEKTDNIIKLNIIKNINLLVLPAVTNSPRFPSGYPQQAARQAKNNGGKI